MSVPTMIPFDWKDPIYLAWRDWRNIVATMKSSPHPHGWEETAAIAMANYELLRAQMMVARYY
jgi:hypothetical protein